MVIGRWGLRESGATYGIWSNYVAGPGNFSKPRSMEVMVKAEWGHSVGDALMEYEGVDERVRL